MEGYSFSRVYILFREFVKHTGRVGWDTLYIKYYKIFQLPNLYF